ncbi:LysE family translocator [Pseudodonghicola xiamenensis]|uniref:Lysine transporter LysE n=1 Tax=Pseudodonghicola xiamenensis TaxID=337702 RepID=A0A8J3H5G7_9RHOB|nr:LysE family translocator [Pseudodonghicola xiamenensis]GHG82393.1 lysine transporter LysE [Pseudodonghicola xiamenensis]
MDMIAPFLAYAAALSIAAVIPGPGIAALVGQALGSGTRTAVFFLSGIALGDLVYLTVAVAGLAAVAQVFAGAFLLVKLLGGAYLLYIAWVFWTSRGGLTEVHALRARRGGRAFLAGFTVTLGNPKTIVFYLALLPTAMDLSKVGVGEWAGLAALTLVILYAVLLPYALLAGRARRLLGRPAALRRLNCGAAAVIGGAGALILGQAALAALRRA